VSERAEEDSRGSNVVFGVVKSKRLIGVSVTELIKDSKASKTCKEE
jgi:hypothetical protein